MTLFEQFQPALFVPERQHSPDLKIELTASLAHSRSTVEVWQRITLLRTGATVSMGNVYLPATIEVPSGFAQCADVVMRAALEAHGPF